MQFWNSQLLDLLLWLHIFFQQQDARVSSTAPEATRNQHRHQIASSHTRKTGIVRYRHIEQRTRYDCSIKNHTLLNLLLHINNLPGARITNTEIAFSPGGKPKCHPQ
jgi:hypothetical protein